MDFEVKHCAEQGRQHAGMNIPILLPLCHLKLTFLTLMWKSTSTFRLVTRPTTLFLYSSLVRAWSKDAIWVVIISRCSGGGRFSRSRPSTSEVDCGELWLSFTAPAYIKWTKSWMKLDLGNNALSILENAIHLYHSCFRVQRPWDLLLQEEVMNHRWNQE